MCSAADIADIVAAVVVVGIDDDIDAELDQSHWEVVVAVASGMPHCVAFHWFALFDVGVRSSLVVVAVCVIAV